MTRRLSSLPARFCWAAVLAMLASPGLPGQVLAAEPPGRSTMRAVRRVHVHRTWCVPGTESDAETGMSLYAHVEALGLRWRSLLVEVRFRTPDGKPVPVAAGAPPGYADEKGRFYMSAWARVFDDRFEWKELRASIPLEKVLDLPPGRTEQLIATFQASSSGLSSMSEAEITVPPAKAPGEKRAVRLLAIDPFPNSPPPDKPSDADAAGKEADAARTESAASGPAREERGLMVESYAEAVGLDGSKIVGRLTLRGEEGRPLMVTDPKTGAKRPFGHVVESSVVSDQAQILLHFVSYRALGLEAGPHRLILSYTANCGGLRATMEEEHVLSVADSGHETPSEADRDDGPPVQQE